MSSGLSALVTVSLLPGGSDEAKSRALAELRPGEGHDHVA